jgi:hypothetical protein
MLEHYVGVRRWKVENEISNNAADYNSALAFLIGQPSRIRQNGTGVVRKTLRE